LFLNISNFILKYFSPVFNLSGFMYMCTWGGDIFSSVYMVLVDSPTLCLEVMIPNLFSGCH
jgi:hypothetical protein